MQTHKTGVHLHRLALCQLLTPLMCSFCCLRSSLGPSACPTWQCFIALRQHSEEREVDCCHLCHHVHCWHEMCSELDLGTPSRYPAITLLGI